MAKVRGVNTRFWSDNFIREHLNPLDRYLFLYFLTNEKTNICGVYELPLSTMASETGLDREMLTKMLVRLEGRVDYHDGWVIIRNFLRYQNTGSKDVQTGITRTMSEIPLKIREYIESTGQSKTVPRPSHDQPRQPEVPIPVPKPILIPKPIPVREGPTPAERARSFFEKNEVYEEMIIDFESKIERKQLVHELNKFILYWTEPNKSGTKQRWEQEQNFEIKRRIVTWMTRANSDFVGKFINQKEIIT